MSKLKLEVLFNAVDKVSGPIKTIIGGSKTMADVLKKTNSELKGLESQQRKISGFRQLTEQSEKTAQALAKNKQTISELKAALKINPQVQENVTALARAEAAHKRLTAVQKSQRTELTGMAQEFNKAGIQMDRLNEEESDLKNKIHLTTMELNKQKEALSRHEKAQKKYEEMQTRMNKASELAKKGLAVSAVAIAGMGYSLKQYEDAEDAAMGLRVSMMQANGQVAKEYGEINKLANSLGTKLPGTTADFQNMMAVLIQQGISAKAILGGVGVAAGYLGVQMKMPFEEAAEFAAKMQDATKTAEKDMLSLMDVIQRGYYLGVDKGNMLQGFSKLSAGMKTIKQEGLEGAKAMAPLLVMADQAAMAGESAGNAFSKIFKSMMDTDGIKKALKDSKTGLTMNFTDGKGEFGGLDNMYKQLEKLKGLSTEKRLPILGDMFGNDAETIQALNLLIDKGKAGYDEVVAKMQAQADLQTRVNAQLSTLKNLKDAAGGTFTSLLSLFGEQLAPQFKTMIEGFTSITEKVTSWAQANPGLASTIARIVAGGALLVGGLSALSIGLVAIFGPMMMVAKGFGVVALAAKGMSMALLTNPITWIVLAIAGAAFLIYKNWAPISAFFSGIWSTIKTAFNGGIKGISALIINWSPIGLFYSAFAKVLSWFGVDLPAKFTGFGAMILEGLKNGILSKVNAVKDAISGAVSGVIDKAKGILGIHSPSRVFMGIGGYTMQGMANGIANANGLPIAATSTATQGVVNTAAQTKPVKPINVGRNNPRSYISQDTIQVHIHVKDGSVVKGTAEAMRQELQRVAEEQQMKKRKFLTDTE
ncbi:phage tail tape measure protein [Acinetobacter baumannii]|uniref:phage tail tape measure protein n=1 Tax=Acinetobacter baumannii TaxID=470 RepID=UPI001C5A99A3|nr:phage tail tape measure protein [Acinetobacter baumannii]MBW4067244.1 phage tail tape measure protein [Acinetobacter baumannii]MBW4097668.1 phage tail tape measure protein [Acinetobacter baumannii]MBW4109521.1 phage tail tape measure protein [Acinetobacter baumannii]MBW4115627.1 phage tail tape measure protein [Acinetobacter baumannii]MBW4119376.1 phage tail tape measure protein [Acinetobacter baumannii]